MSQSSYRMSADYRNVEVEKPDLSWDSDKVPFVGEALPKNAVPPTESAGVGKPPMKKSNNPFFQTTRDDFFDVSSQTKAAPKLKQSTSDFDTNRVVPPELSENFSVAHQQPSLTPATTYQTSFADPAAVRSNVTPGVSYSNSSVRDLLVGTGKTAGHTPGYCGFVPATEETNPTGTKALAQANIGNLVRPSTKDFRMFTNKNYPLQLPGYTGFQPQDVENSNEPSFKRDMTTLGVTHNTDNSFPPHSAYISKERGAYNISNKMREDFFQPGVESESDKGIANSDLFYHMVRPQEGIPKVLHPSEETVPGYAFSTYTQGYIRPSKLS